MQKLKQQLIFDRVLEKLPDHVTLLLVILSGFLLARLTWMLFPADPSLSMAAQEKPQSTPEVEVVQAKSPVDLGREIASYHLLGVYRPPAAPAPVVQRAPEPPPPPPPKPRPNMSLVSVYSGDPGVAVITLNGRQNTVVVGENIKDSEVKLEKVYGDKVEISWNGEKSTLAMPKRSNATAGEIVTPDDSYIMEEPPPPDFSNPEDFGIQPMMPDGSEVDMQPMDSGMPVEGSSLSTGGGAAGASRAQPAATNSPSLANFRQQVLQDANRMTDLIRASKVVTDGQVAGYRVVPGSNVRLFQQTGLQPGDIVTAINGTALNSDMAGMRAMNSLRTSSNAQLTVLRGGQVTSVQLSF